MERRGSITVFLALILSLMLSLVCTSIESVRMAAARAQILNGMDIGLYSLFGQYDKELLEKYDLFAVDGSCGGGELKMSAVYDNMEGYIKPILKQNSQKLSLEQGGFTGYRLLTDEGGEVFYQQIVRYMKETLGSQGIQLLLQKVRDNEQKTKEAEAKGELAEQGDALQSYESEMSSAAQNSQAAAEEAAKKAEEAGEGAALPPEAVTRPPVEAVNPISTIRRIRKMGILELVIPGGRGVSEKEVSKGSLVSGRALQTGMPMFGAVNADDSYTASILFQQYLMSKLGNFRKPSADGLSYQIEYILGDKTSDMANLKSVAKKLLLIREGVNLTCLAADSGKRAQAQALALAIASGFLIPPASAVIEAALLLCWSFAESILDVRELFDGGKVPAVKTSADWQLSLENLPNLLEGLDSSRRDSGKGMSYEDYLQVLLLAKSKEKKVQGGMDMIEQSIRNREGRGEFRLDSCVVALEAVMDVKANRRKTFTVTKQYCYD